MGGNEAKEGVKFYKRKKKHYAKMRNTGRERKKKTLSIQSNTSNQAIKVSKHSKLASNRDWSSGEGKEGVREQG